MIRLGVLGAASVARRRTLPALRAVPELRLVAVASSDADRAAAITAEFGGEPVTGYAALLDRSDVDAVYVPVPTGLHARWTVEALKAGKHVLVEKPTTTSTEDTAALIDLAAANGLVLAENFTFLHHRQHALAAELLADGAIGELRDVDASFGFPPLAATDVRYSAELGGGALLDAGVYPIRLAMLFLGGDPRVCGASAVVDGVDVAGACLLADAAGVTARLAYGFTHGYRNAYTLWGSAGSLTVPWAFSPPSDHKAIIILDRGGVRTERVAGPDAQFANTARAFARAILGVGPPPDHASMLATARLVDQVRSASH